MHVFVVSVYILSDLLQLLNYTVNAHLFSSLFQVIWRFTSCWNWALILDAEEHESPVTDPPCWLIILWIEAFCPVFSNMHQGSGNLWTWAQLLPSLTSSITPWNISQYFWMFDCSSSYKVHPGLGAVHKDSATRTNCSYCHICTFLFTFHWVWNTLCPFLSLLCWFFKCSLTKMPVAGTGNEAQSAEVTKKCFKDWMFCKILWNYAFNWSNKTVCLDCRL